MNVSEAVAARTTIRRFTDQKVEDALVKKLLEVCSRSFRKPTCNLGEFS